MTEVNFGRYRAIETPNGFFVECDFFAQSKNESFPIFAVVKNDGMFEIHDNGFIKSDYGTNEFALAGIQLVVSAFGLQFDGSKIFVLASTLDERLQAFGNMLSACYCIESSFSGGVQ